MPGTSGAQVAPGAETVGQAQIVTEFAPAFTLDGLFGAADAGAFGSGEGADSEMGMEIADTPEGGESMDEDGYVFYAAPVRAHTNTLIPPIAGSRWSRMTLRTASPANGRAAHPSQAPLSLRLSPSAMVRGHTRQSA